MGDGKKIAIINSAQQRTLLYSTNPTGKCIYGQGCSRSVSQYVGFQALLRPKVLLLTGPYSRCWGDFLLISSAAAGEEVLGLLEAVTGGRICDTNRSVERGRARRTRTAGRIKPLELREETTFIRRGPKQRALSYIYMDYSGDRSAILVRVEMSQWVRKT